MTIIQIPEDLSIARQDFGLRYFDLTFGGSDTGAVQTVARAPVRRTCSLVGNEQDLPENAAAWSVLLHALRGRVNQLALYNATQPEPRGTARGNWTTVGATAAGASTMVIAMGADQAGQTLLAGDWIGVGQASVGPSRQLLHVQADAMADGAGNAAVSFEAVLRVALAAGAPVAWYRPTCLMRRTTEESTWGMHPGQLVGGFSLDLMESWE